MSKTKFNIHNKQMRIFKNFNFLDILVTFLPQEMKPSKHTYVLIYQTTSPKRFLI